MTHQQTTPDQAAQQAAPEDVTQQPAFSVTISYSQDGTYSVSMSESDQSEGGEQDEPVTADNIDDALSAAKQMIQAETGESEQEPQGDGNEKLSPEDAQSAWKQMAAAKKSKMME